ncbi:MAG: phosphoglycerate dehydrogenase [Acidimicrobiia bacterium]|nr:phosphoglycerate dehydrogenase [Acidimicrobiia bacterium]
MTTASSIGDVLVTWPGYDVDGERTGQVLRDAGLSIRMEPKTGPRSPAELRHLLGDAVAAIVSTDPFDRDVIGASPNLRVIARTGVGTDTVDLVAATEAGVLVTTTPGANEEAVADHTLALVLSLVRRLPEHDRSLRAHRWDRAGTMTPGDLYSSTVGLVGSGRIGRAVARRLRAFGSTILVCDPALEHPAAGTELVSLDELLARSDVVSLHVPLLPETSGLIGARELALMRPTAVLVNTARGRIVDEPALADALRRGQLAGAALDAFAEEPPFDSELLELPTVIVTPHVAGLSLTSIATMNEQATQSVVDVLRGEVPIGTVNPEAR